MRNQFLLVASRIAVGTLAISLNVVPSMKIAAYVAGRYSLRRHIGPPSARVPIISFSTQQHAILLALAQAFCLEALALDCAEIFKDTRLDVRARHAMGCIFKAVGVEHCQSSLYVLAERCGAQGLFGYNQIIQKQVSLVLLFPLETHSLALSARN